MKHTLPYIGFFALLFLIAYGTIVISREWKIKSVHDHGQFIDVTIDKLDCTKKIMSFRWSGNVIQKKIDERDCVVYGVGQKIKLKYDPLHPDTFLFVNERNPNQLIVGGLEIVLGIIGLITGWPFIKK